MVDRFMAPLTFPSHPLLLVTASQGTISSSIILFNNVNRISGIIPGELFAPRNSISLQITSQIVGTAGISPLLFQLLPAVSVP